jgi:HEAT repeat protein
MSPIPERKGPEGIPEGLPPEEVKRFQQLQSKLTEFILHLIQAFLRTGYYTSDHPESRKAKEGLYQQFKNIFDQEDELSFLARDEEDQKEILVEGVVPLEQRLSRMMMKGMGEIYIPKFVNYLERKELLSLTLKSRMGPDEFTQFIDVMSDPTQLDLHRKEDKEKFLQNLASRGIYNISIMFNEELLFPDREISWRARVTLSRMKKELKMIPYFQKKSGKELQDIRIYLIRDAIRTLRQPDLLYAVLQNSDLAASAETTEEIVEYAILSALPKPQLIGTSKFFLKEHLTLKKLQKQDDAEKRSDRLLKRVCAQLKETGTQEAESLLEEIFRLDFIDLEDLPPALKDKILLERLTDKFLKFTEQFFEQLDQAKEKERFIAIAGSFIKMIPELIRRDRYSEVHRIIETFRRHFHLKKMWGILAGHVLEEIGSGMVPEILAEKFLAGKKEIRSAIIPLFVSLEIGSIPHLLAILKKSEDQWVRKNACEALIQIGPVAGAHLLKELQEQQISGDTTCDILRVLGEIKSQEWKGPLMTILKRHASHESPRLREQALSTLFQIGGKEGEEIYLSGLNDSSLEVRKRAIWCLGMVKSSRGAERMLDLLKQIPTTPTPETDILETQIYHALGFSGNMTIEGKTTEQVLLDIVEKRGMKQWWGLVHKNPLSEEALGAISEALGKIGTGESLKLLTKLAKSKEGSEIPKIKEAIKKIEGRAGK